MASTAPFKRKRSGEDVISTVSKRVLRPRSAPEMTTIVIQPASISKTRVKRSIAKRTAPTLPTTTNPSSNLLLQKDQIIEQLRLELAEAHNELAKTQRRLEEVEKRLPKPATAV
ncbi:unnamed protein product [Aureobasidium vineae]|uniref:Uncharacterized protein n=1 Tax=Aureobasidium vineae TaxID=2773715 RepID=A0A9N8J726_9PEZI|nr:unnamed protein product [Aureobasidium vineae]